MIWIFTEGVRWWDRIQAIFYLFFYFKVQFFWEGHKNEHNRPYGFEIYLVNVKTMRTIAKIFVASLEKLNFKNLRSVST